MRAAQKREMLIVLPNRRGVEIRISCCNESHPLISSTFLCARSNEPGFSVLKKTRVAARRYSSWNMRWWYDRFQPQRSSALSASRRRAMWKKPSRTVKPTWPSGAASAAAAAAAADAVLVLPVDVTLSNRILHAGMSVLALSCIDLSCLYCTAYCCAAFSNDLMGFCRFCWWCLCGCVFSMRHMSKHSSAVSKHSSAAAAAAAVACFSGTFIFHINHRRHKHVFNQI
jgi:hypothetical protein